MAHFAIPSHIFIGNTALAEAMLTLKNGAAELLLSPESMWKISYDAAA